jgi:hypothetical protein
MFSPLISVSHSDKITWNRSCHQLPRSTMHILILLVLHIFGPSGIRAEEHPVAGDMSGQLAASWENVSLGADEFYLLLNEDIQNYIVHDLDSLKERKLLEMIIERSMNQQYAINEAVSLGANEDKIFIRLLLKLRRQDHQSIIVIRHLKPTLPEPKIIDTSEPGEKEMLDFFMLFQKSILFKEFYRIHFIFIKKDGENPENNKLKEGKARAVLERVRAGEDFVKVMMEVTEIEKPYNKVIELRRDDKETEQMRDYVKNMTPGQISDVIDAKQGYYIIYCLPDQNISDVSSYEAIIENAMLREKMVELIMTHRRRTDPLNDYVDELALWHHCRVFDPAGLEDGEWPPLDTVLAGIDSDQWTLADMVDIFESMDMDPKEVIEFAKLSKYLRNQLLLSAEFDADEYKETESDLLAWKKTLAQEHESWLRRYHQRTFLENSSETTDEEGVKWKAFEFSRDKILAVQDQMKNEMKVYINLENLDMSRVIWADPPNEGPAQE